MEINILWIKKKIEKKIKDVLKQMENGEQHTRMYEV